MRWAHWAGKFGLGACFAGRADNLSRSSLAHLPGKSGTPLRHRPSFLLSLLAFSHHSPSVGTAKALSSAAARYPRSLPPLLGYVVVASPHSFACAPSNNWFVSSSLKLLHFSSSSSSRAVQTGTGILAAITMRPVATASAPSSLLPLRIARQGIKGGQVWGERSLCVAQSQRATRGATISARASMNITCCANQTQTAQRKSYSGPTSPPSGSVKEKVKPRLDDGGVGFPPFRFGGGGGGGGGGGSNSSGGFILYVMVLLLDYLREFERNLQNGSRRGSDYDNGLAPQ
ncbi:unnamed protein product [Urochloa decumbens]|uniref:Uncharacterized protein n=1 Tax=Urochloa decumbens TaxID=240449 RepID=A0ABC8VFJ7_9POAL